MVIDWLWSYMRMLLQDYWPVIFGVIMLSIVLLFAAIYADD